MATHINADLPSFKAKRIVARGLSRRFTLRGIVTVVYFCAVFTMLLAPLIVVIGGSFSAPANDAVVMSYVEFPPERLTLDWYRKIPESQLKALGFSFALAFAVALAACVIGVPAAIGLVRGRFFGKGAVAAILRAPLQIPHVVSGIAFLQLF
jgi:putative spermidine/putrescine transport system permease protein